MSIPDILAPFTLTAEQRQAVCWLDGNVVVTAGAGSGKTRTLIARYLLLLEQGHSPRSVAAITFTNKAAREMRNRLRAAVEDRVVQLNDHPQRAHWEEILGSMDAARVGTIHSLCSEILRAHPAEAGLDPAFEVIEEGTSALLLAEAVQDAIAWSTSEETLAEVFAFFSPGRLLDLIEHLLRNRQPAGEALIDLVAGRQTSDLIADHLQRFLSAQPLRALLGALEEMENGEQLLEEGGEKLVEQVGALLTEIRAARQALSDGHALQASLHLFTARRRYLGLSGGKRNSVIKELLRDLQTSYDEQLNPWLGGKESTDAPPDPQFETALGPILVQVGRIYERALAIYRAALDERQALDFEDLEASALALLADDQVRARWQREIGMLLVDEFQDTNQRQRRIIEALCAGPCSLFIVGDARQSIYRFRGADVTVFRQSRDQILAAGGISAELQETFRAHQPLLNVLDQVLGPLMGEGEQEQPYRIPYTRLVSNHEDNRLGGTPPVELLIGLGGKAAQGRAAAARGLAQELLRLRQQGVVRAWDDVALLFRTANSFAEFEAALELFGIPFVTVAGRGFYDRPEIRDVLNLLRALAEPEDELALAGLLRSPAFGLSDPGLYMLRWDGDQKRRLVRAIQGDLSFLQTEDREAVRRAEEFLIRLAPRVDRLPVAELLKEVLDAVDYRAILASAKTRLWRNLDKLLADAHVSDLHSVREFLEYVARSQAVGAREGEAPVEAEGSVRLMTIHKAKGLEFEVVALADASRQPRAAGDPVYFLPSYGMVCKPDLAQGTPLGYSLARWLDRQQNEAEEDRLLYVGATRVRQKLLINGYLTQARRSWSAAGHLKRILALLGLESAELASRPGTGENVPLAGGAVLGVQVVGETAEARLLESPIPEWPTGEARPLFTPPEIGELEVLDPQLEEEPPRTWRATGRRIHAPAAVVGKLVHEALRSWILPPDPALGPLLETTALSYDLVDPGQRRQARLQAETLLRRLREHAIWQEIEQADQRYHEIPYVYQFPDGSPDPGQLDLLYRQGAGWVIVDFKTDELHTEEELAERILRYRRQLGRYQRAVQALLGGPVDPRLCFLDFAGQVRIESP